MVPSLDRFLPAFQAFFCQRSHPLKILGDAKHHFLRLLVFYRFGNDTRLLGAVAPVLWIIQKPR